jgi:hypothetical protein
MSAHITIIAVVMRSVFWQDIISKRNITRAEMDALNPGIDLDRLTANQVTLCF